MSKKNKYSKSFELALSAMSCAFASVFLALGIVNQYLLATGYFMAAICLMIPLSKQFFLGDFLAYIGTCILAILLGAIVQFWDLVPFIMFFGLHPLVNCLQIKFRVPKWIAFLVKAIWFDATLYVMYLLVFGGVLGGNETEFYEIVNTYIWAFIAVGGTIFFLVYDYFMFKIQIAVNALVYRIKK
jgi:hypothetical protein